MLLACCALALLLSSSPVQLAQAAAAQQAAGEQQEWNQGQQQQRWHQHSAASSIQRRAEGRALAADEHVQQNQAYSAICAVAKDENRYVREWVHYHKCLGVGHVYLYDHGSAQPLSDELQEFISQGYLTYTSNTTGLSHTKYQEGFSSNLERFMTTIQGQVYKDCLERHGHKHTFVGFIDVDEFVVLLDTGLTSVDQLLRGLEAYGGVSLYWTLLGSSGHETPPSAWVTSSYTRCTPARHHVNTQFKSFVNTRLGPVMYSPHRARFTLPYDTAAGTAVGGSSSKQDGGGAASSLSSGPEPAFLVNELGQRIPAGRNKQGSHQRATVYHYATRSKADFLAKLKRGGGAGVTRPPHYLRRLDKQCTETCGAAVETYLRTCRAHGLASRLVNPPA